MVKDNIMQVISDEIALIQQDITELENVNVIGYDEVEIQPLAFNPNLIQYYFLWGSITKDNDLSNKYSFNFTINIDSELNGYKLTQKLFNELFNKLNRKWHSFTSDGNTYKYKMRMTSPVLTNTEIPVNNGFINTYTMSVEVDFSINQLVGAKYELKVGSDMSFIQFQPRQPQTMKQLIGGIDTQITTSSKETLFNSQSETVVHQFVILCENNALCKALINEAFGAKQSYTLKITIGSENGVDKVVKTISDLVATQCQFVYDEENGDNVISITLQKGV